MFLMKLRVWFRGADFGRMPDVKLCHMARTSVIFESSKPVAIYMGYKNSEKTIIKVKYILQWEFI